MKTQRNRKSVICQEISNMIGFSINMLNGNMSVLFDEVFYNLKKRGILISVNHGRRYQLCDTKTVHFNR